MNPRQGNFDDFGMDTISLAGSLEAKLKAVRDAGFGQIMLSARDVVGHPDGLDAAVRAVRASGWYSMPAMSRTSMPADLHQPASSAGRMNRS